MCLILNLSFFFGFAESPSLFFPPAPAHLQARLLSCGPNLHEVLQRRKEGPDCSRAQRQLSLPLEEHLLQIPGYEGVQVQVRGPLTVLISRLPTDLFIHLNSPKHKSDIIKEFLGNTVQLIRHKDASFVIEDIFVEHATSAQRKGMIAEFFGPEYSLFKQASPKTLAEIILEFPEKRPHIMKNISESVLGSLNKGTVRFNLIHHVISEYLESATDEEAAVCPLLRLAIFLRD